MSASDQLKAAAADLTRKIDRAYARKPQKKQRQRQAVAPGGGIKVRGTGDQRVESLRIADIFRAHVVDSTNESFVFEIVGTAINDGSMKPGMFANVTLESPVAEQSVWLPSSAVATSDLPQVLTIEDGAVAYEMNTALSDRLVHMTVTAKDTATGKDQRITITASSGLSEDQIDQLLAYLLERK